MAGARPVKNSLMYELSVAAYFASQVIKIGDWALNLKGADVDPNRRPYPSSLTDVGYTAEVDITITKLKEQYNISCKFSERDSILKHNSPEFLKAIMELLPLHKIENVYPTMHMNYFLVTNSRISAELSNKNAWENSAYCELSENLRKYSKNVGSTADGNLFCPSNLERFLPLLTIYPISIDNLERLDENDLAYHQALDRMPRCLLNTPKQGLSLNQIISADLTLFCNSSSHKDCYDCVIDQRYCHVGSVRQIGNNLDDLLKRRLVTLVELSPTDVIANFRTIFTPEKLPPEHVAYLISSILNSKELVQIKNSYTFYVVPASFQIIAFRAFEIAQKIKATRDNHERVYPAQISEINKLDLGYKALQELTQLAYLKGFSSFLPDSYIVLDKE